MGSYDIQSIAYTLTQKRSSPIILSQTTPVYPSHRRLRTTSSIYFDHQPTPSTVKNATDTVRFNCECVCVSPVGPLQHQGQCIRSLLKKAATALDVANAGADDLSCVSCGSTQYLHSMYLCTG